MARKPVSTSLDESLMKKLKIYCVEDDVDINETIENAINLWLALRAEKRWDDVYDSLLGDNRYSNELRHFIDEKFLNNK